MKLAVCVYYINTSKKYSIFFQNPNYFFRKNFDFMIFLDLDIFSYLFLFFAPHFTFPILMKLAVQVYYINTSNCLLIFFPKFNFILQTVFDLIFFTIKHFFNGSNKPHIVSLYLIKLCSCVWCFIFF